MSGYPLAIGAYAEEYITEVGYYVVISDFKLGSFIGSAI